MSSLPLASISDGPDGAIVIRKVARASTWTDELTESDTPSLAEQRAHRRRLRSLPPDKRAGLRTGLRAEGMTRQPEPRQPGRTRSTGGPRNPDRPGGPLPAPAPYRTRGAA